MAVADGAQDSSHGDSVLEGALAEMESEGAFEGGDPATGSDASQTGDDSGAASPASDQSPATGDEGGSGEQVSSAATEDTASQGTGAQASDDPLSGTEPFTYESNGETKTLEGVFRVPGEGLLVPEESVHTLQSLAERADSLDRTSREYLDRATDLERLSEWRQTGEDGKEQIFQGREGLEQMRVQLGSMGAALSTLHSIFQPDAQGNYPTLEGLVTVDPNTGRIVRNEEAWANVVTRSENAEIKTAQAVREWLQSRASGKASPAQDSAPDRITSEAPRIIESVVKSAGADMKALTEKDRSVLSAQLPRYVRQVNEEDRRFNPSLRIGSPIVDASFTQVVKDRLELRAEISSKALAAEKAGKFNAGQDKGRQAAPTKPKPKPATLPGAEQTRKKADWDGPLEEALRDMSIA